MPEPLRAWVVDAAERMNAPADFIAAGAVVAASSLLGRRVAIRPKRYDDWEVIPNLWGAVVGRPAVKKSPALKAATEPITQLAKRADREHEAELEEHALDKMVYDARLAGLKEKMKTAGKKVASGDGDATELDEIRAEVANLEVVEEPRKRRYVTNDTTTEKLGEVLRDNPEGFLLFRDELMGWLQSLDRRDRPSDRAFFLECWTGNGSFEWDRIERGHIHVPALCLSILGGIQPGPLSSYVTAAAEDDIKADGLLQRFQVLVYPDPVPFDRVDRGPNLEAMTRAMKVFRGLAEFDAGTFGAVAEREDGVPSVRFTHDAQEVFDAWADRFMRENRTAGRPEALEAHFAEYESLFASLALIFEAISDTAGRTEGYAVREESAIQAEMWCDYLASHAFRVYTPIANTDVIVAETLYEKIHDGDVQDGASIRDIYRKQWSGLTSRRAVLAAVAVLEESGIARIEKVPSERRGRKSEVLRVHPELR